MPLGYDKEHFASILQDIIYIVTIQLAFLSLEIDSKFGAELSIIDQNKMDTFLYRFKTFMTLVAAWIVFTGIYFLYRYGLGALLVYLVASLILFGYVYVTYSRLVDRVAKQTGVRGMTHVGGLIGFVRG